MHFHPFGIPVDEFLTLVVNAVQLPPSAYFVWARETLARARYRLVGG